MRTMDGIGLLERLTIRTVLLAGFGLMLGLWLFAGYQVTQRLQEAQRESAGRGRALPASAGAARVGAHTGAGRVGAGARRAARSRATAGRSSAPSIEQAYAAIDYAADACVPFLESAASASASPVCVRRSRSEWPPTKCWQPTAAGGRPTARDLMRRFMPKREAAIRVSDEVQALNRAAFIEQQRDVTEMQAAMQRQVWTVFGVALAISLVIGWLAFRHAARLERRLTEQHEREERIASDLQRLSARLVHAREEEQRRIARELHDEVGQALSAVKVELAVAERAHRADGRSARAACRCADQRRQRAAQRSRSLASPAPVGARRSRSRCRARVAGRRLSPPASVSPSSSLISGHDRRLHAETERAIYRIVQEALTNIARHAEAHDPAMCV